MISRGYRTVHHACRKAFREQEVDDEQNERDIVQELEDTTEEIEVFSHCRQ